jgi:hypothetical protein
MLYREIIAVCSQIHTKHTHALCGQNVELLNVKLLVTELYIEIQSVPHSEHSVSVIQTRQLMLYKEIIAVCSQIHTEHTNTLCGRNVGMLNVKLMVLIVTAGRLRGYEHETRQQACIVLQYMESIVGIFTVF